MRRLARVLSLCALLDTVLAQNALPYNPTRVLRSPNQPYALILQPNEGSKGQSQLSYLDLSQSFATSAGATSTISQTVPFLQDDNLTPYTVMMDANGNVTAVTGNCSDGSSGVKIWRYAGTSGPTAGTWAQHTVSSTGPQTQGEQAGANFLADGIAFSQFTASDPSNTDFYVFGGMCPNSNSTTATWTSSAQYSNLMITIDPSDGELSTSTYSIDLVLSRGPPIAEAGFTMTGLSPAFSANISGQAQTQQQTFVLLGGHTQSAFINMSQVALWSLPQQGWTFLPVAQPGQVQTDLAKRQQTTIEPRSGHAAVLSEDGKSIYIIGGWVGDTNTPAKPQIAKLTVGTGYGGSGTWAWSVMSNADTPPFGSGIFGHGAAMLPGGLILVAGGRTIGASSRTRRATQSNSQFYLYNTTANTWINTYTPPDTVGSATDTGPLNKASQKAGLGAGLGVGCALVIGLLAFYLWYSKRTKKARDGRERELLTYSSQSSFNNTDRNMLERGGVVEHNDAPALGRFWSSWENRGYANIPPARPQMSGPMNPMQVSAGSTALFMDAPSPTRGLRKNHANRPYQYQAAPRWENLRLANRRSGVIHPIAELENEDGTESQTSAQNQETLSDAERKLRELERVLGSPGTDPFADHSSNPDPLGSHPVSPEGITPIGGSVQRSIVTRKPVPSALFTDAYVANTWLAMGHEHDSPYDQPGRQSPARTDDRTLSSLSEASEGSHASYDSITRPVSSSSGALLSAAAARSTSSRGGSSHGASSSSQGGSRTPFHNRARSSTNGSVQEPINITSGASDSDSFTTASTNFTRLRNEGQNLLGGRPHTDSDDPYQRAMAALPPSPKIDLADDEFPLTRPRKRGWMGSLRRALNAVAMGDRTFSLTGSTDGTNTAASSPIKEKSEENFHAGPRRTVSEGGALLRQKRGQNDWNDNAQFPPYRDDPEDNDWGHPRKSADGRNAEEEWDVEGAVAKRDVQVMFSVPKARLRVVNADMDRVSLRSASDGALSRTESMKRKEEFSRAEPKKPLRDYTFEDETDDETDDRWKKGS